MPLIHGNKGNPVLRKYFYSTSVQTICKKLSLIDSTSHVKTGTTGRVTVGHIYYLLQECIKKKDLTLGRKVYDVIKKNSLESNAFLSSHVIRMFTICGSLIEATEVFHAQSSPSVFSWTAIINAHATLGQKCEAVGLYYDMCSLNLQPDGHVFVVVLKACADVLALVDGRIIHGDVIRTSLESNTFITNILIDMYCKCGSLQDAQVVFNTSKERTVVTWSSLLSGYVQYGHPQKALELFHMMHCNNLLMDNVVFITVLQACGSLNFADYGKLIHNYVVESAGECDLLIVGTLIDMYAKCGCLSDAEGLFNKTSKRDVVMWNALIGGHAETGDNQKSISLFLSMQEVGLEPDEVTISCVLKGQVDMSSLDQGKLIHYFIVEKGFDPGPIIGSSLIDMYIRCKSTQDAYSVFQRLPNHDVVTWSAMIAGLVHDGRVQEAVKLSQKMRSEGVQANSVTFACILNACSSTAALIEGRLVHVETIKSGCECDVHVASALIDMFAKCGSLEDARRLFATLSMKDVVVWNSIIAGCAEHSDFKAALEYYKQMREDGLEPDDATFASLLCTCSHLGLVNEGCSHFNLLRMQHGIEPTIDHYNCIVDLLGRAGHLCEALDILHIMPFQENIIGWITLLSHSKIHGDLGQAQQSFQNAVCINENSSSAYVLMSRIYAQFGQWEDAYL